MERAAMPAEDLGQTSLAAMLQHEVAGYRSSNLKITATTIYTEIEDATIDNPEADFLQVVDWATGAGIEPEGLPSAVPQGEGRVRGSPPLESGANEKQDGGIPNRFPAGRSSLSRFLR